MKISTKGEYGIRAMLYIAMHAGEESVNSHEIATHQAIPEPYLRQILAQLSKNGLIESSRGPQGGHALGKPADEIPVRDILMILEGQTTSVDQILALPCAIGVGTEHCVIREMFLEVKREVERILGETTVHDLAERQRKILEQDISVPLDLQGAGKRKSSVLPVLRE